MDGKTLLRTGRASCRFGARPFRRGFPACRQGTPPASDIEILGQLPGRRQARQNFLASCEVVTFDRPILDWFGSSRAIRTLIGADELWQRIIRVFSSGIGEDPRPKSALKRQICLFALRMAGDCGLGTYSPGFLAIRVLTMTPSRMESLGLMTRLSPPCRPEVTSICAP